MVALELVRHPPRTVGELAEVLGAQLADCFHDGMPLAGSVGLPGVVARFAWDMYHQRPIRTPEALAGALLESWTARFDAGRTACERELHARHGAPRSVEGRRRYGDLYVREDAHGDELVLEWHGREPDWARPLADPRARREALAALAARLERAARVADAEAALAALVLELGPPLRAVELAHALGHPDAVARTVDVHMSSWVLALPREGRTAALRAGRWELEVRLSRAPSGGPVPGVDVPAAAVRALGADDTVASVRVVR